jgi:antitoxin component YwqK of YwqJK toxin-antitoxin module
MKYARIITPLLLSIGIIGFTLREPRREADDPGMQVVGESVLRDGQPFTGVLIERNLRHDLLAESHYKNGLKDGLVQTFHHDGTLIGQAHFSQGKKHGRQDTWYADGKIRALAYFKEGVAEGTLTEWHPNGRVYREQKIVDGVEVANKMFYESGVIYSNYVVRDDRDYGIRGEPLCRTTKQEGFK